MNNIRISDLPDATASATLNGSIMISSDNQSSKFSLKDLVRMVQDKAVAIAVIRCKWCGQWGARYCECKRCGAPIE